MVREEQRPYVIAYRKEYNRLHPRILTPKEKEEQRWRGIKYRLKLKQLVIDHYGGKSACCGRQTCVS